MAPTRPPPLSALDPFETRGDAALKQRPIEAQCQRDIAAVDHLVSLLGRSRYSADGNAAPDDALLRARHQSLDFGIIDPASFIDAGGEVARSDHGEVDAGHSHDLIDALNRLDVLDCYHADHVSVGTRHVFGHRNAPAKRRVKWTPEPIAARRIAH